MRLLLRLHHHPRHQAGLPAWRAGNFTDAIDAFEKTLMLHPRDAASLLMIERCRHQLENPASADWDGTTVARTK
jgi:adenylate cyclase